MSTTASTQPAPPSEQSRRVLIVTGMSGAGKSTALKSLEDIGYETVDNIPLSLMVSLVSPMQSELPFQGEGAPLAIGVDIRTRDFDARSFINYWDDLLHHTDISVTVLFLDCDDEELNRRYTETRHRHPLAADRPVIDGIRHEREIVSDLRRRADQVIDTTQLTPRELNNLITGHFSLENRQRLSVFVTSFSYRRGIPREADLVFDVRFLRNPHYETELKELTGLDVAVGAYIREDNEFNEFIQNLTRLFEQLLPRYAAEGKSYLTIAIGCTGGKHRSVFVAEQLKLWLSEHHHKAQINHRDLNKTKDLN
ncbi:MAG: RNase adapter RapZ [Rhodospirillales bacterium]